MAETVTGKVALATIERAVALADAPPIASDTATTWTVKVSDFSLLAKRLGYVTYIAVLGNALLAKASNPRVDVFSLKRSDNSPGAYSARTPADGVLAPAARKYHFDIGAPGANPLNNSPFYGKPRVNRDIVVDPAAAPVMTALLGLLHDVSLLQQSEALIALEQFIRVRRGYVPVFVAPTSGAAALTAEGLIEAIAVFVAERGDGGARAQAVVGGLLDALYDTARVRVAQTNEPDRKFPGDVCILESAEAAAAVARVIEVRDKRVGDDAVLRLIEKVARAGVHRAAIVTIAVRQPQLNERQLRERARDSDVDLEIYPSWSSLVRMVTSAASAREGSTINRAIDHVRDRLKQLRVEPDAIEAWDQRTRLSVSSSSAPSRVSDPSTQLELMDEKVPGRR